ncbi:MAG: SlyX family protein [Pseudomonadota bacterium]
MSERADTLVEERLNELEFKLAFVEQLLGDLNDALTTESARVSALERQIDGLQQRLQSAVAGASGDPRSEPPPPHY